jgi:hypothetical protein
VWEGIRVGERMERGKGDWMKHEEGKRGRSDKREVSDIGTEEEGLGKTTGQAHGSVEGTNKRDAQNERGRERQVTGGGRKPRGDNGKYR